MHYNEGELPETEMMWRKGGSGNIAFLIVDVWGLTCKHMGVVCFTSRREGCLRGKDEEAKRGTENAFLC